jgi:hypothetical protein
MAKIQFYPDSSGSKRAIVASFDLCGFSTFCKHPEAHAILPKFISGVFDELDSVLIGALQEFVEGVNPQKGLAIITSLPRMARHWFITLFIKRPFSLKFAPHPKPRMQRTGQRPCADVSALRRAGHRSP